MIKEIADGIIKRVQEVTTSANIAYLPSGFTTVKKAIKALAKKKQKWGINIIDDQLSESYVVCFEDALNVKVQKKWWKDFLRRILGKDSVVFTDKFMVDLGGYVKEAQEEQMSDLFKELKQALSGLLVQEPISTIDADIMTWLKYFGRRRYTTSASTMLKYESLDRDLSNLVKQLQTAYKDDRGTIEMIIAAVKERRPLNVFDVFSRYNYLIGSRIYSVREGVGLSFEAYVDMAFVPAESIIVDDKKVASELDDYGIVKVANSVIFPRGKTFRRKYFKLLRGDIDDLEEEGET